MTPKKGFLLLEVIVSLVILTGGLLFVTQAYFAALKTAQRTRENFQLGLWLEEGMFGFEEKGQVKEGLWQGELEGRKDVLWKMKAVATQASDLHTVNLSVFDRHTPQQERSLWTFLNKS
ncbi:MAG: hypothetical protein HY209_01135 [Candidatus Omnitrophica bacterium]|nr:hypothetical protein [Candidatus Omnitrophota bacterium]